MSGYLFILLSMIQNLSLSISIISGLSTAFFFYLFVLTNGDIEKKWKKIFKISIGIFAGAVLLTVIVPDSNTLLKGAFLNYANWFLKGS